MKRGKKMNGEIVATQHFVKSTYLIDPVLKANLQYLGLHQQREQSDVVRDALATYVRANGLDPFEMPRFVFDQINGD